MGGRARFERIHNITALYAPSGIRGPMPGYGLRHGGDSKVFWNLEGSVSSFSRFLAKKAAQLFRLFMETASPRKRATPYLSLG